MQLGALQPFKPVERVWIWQGGGNGEMRTNLLLSYTEEEKLKSLRWHK